MKLFEHYIQLYQQLQLEANEKRNDDGMILEDAQRYTVSLDQLAEILHCSKRNVKWLLKHMQTKHWVVWKPGRGRGHRSEISLLKSLEEVIMEQVQEQIEADNWEQTAQLFNQYKKKLHKTDVIHQMLLRLSPAKMINRGRTTLDTLRFISYRPLSPLDPALISRRTEQHIIRQIFEGLVAYNAEARRLEPHLALEWESNQDHVVWTFFLRKGLKFHNDSPLLAEDVVHSFERLKRISSPYNWMYGIIKQVTALSAQVVQFSLACPVPFFQHFLATYPFFIVKEDDAALYGTGPFKITNEGEHRLVLEAFPAYFGHRAQLDRIEIYYMSGMYDSASTEEPHLPEQVNFQHYQYPSFDPEGWKTVSSVDRGFKYLAVNLHKNGPLLHKETRRALFHLINKQAMIQELTGNRWRTAEYIFPSKNNEYHSSSNNQYHFTANDDCSSASIRSACLQENYGLTSATHSYPTKGTSSDQKNDIEQEKGINLEILRTIHQPIQLITYHGAGNEEDAFWIKERAKLYQIDVQVSILAFEELLKPASFLQGDLFIGEQWMNHDSEWTFLAILTQDKSIIKKCLEAADLYPSIEKWINSILSVPDAQVRKTAFMRLEKELLDQYALYPLYQWRQIAQFPEHVQGVRLNEIGWVDYHRLWFKK